MTESMDVLSKRFTLTHCDVNTGIMHRPVKHWWYLHCVEADTWSRLQLEIQISWIMSYFNDELHKVYWNTNREFGEITRRYKCMLSTWNRPVLKIRFTFHSNHNFFNVHHIEIIEIPLASAPVAPSALSGCLKTSKTRLLWNGEASPCV